MKSRINIKTILALLIVCIIALAALVHMRNTKHSASPQYVLRYADNQPDGYPTTQAARFFADQVYKRSGGRIKILIYCDELLGTESDTIKQVQFGGIDFARVSTAQLSEFAPDLTLLALPFLYDDSKHMWNVLNSELGDRMLDAAKDADVIGLSWYDAGVRSFYTTYPIDSLEDLKGMTIRVQISYLMDDFVRCLGANPIAITYSSVYPKLKTGSIQGAENNLPSYEASRHYEVAKYLLLDEHSRIPEMQIMSKNLLEILPAEDISLIQKCAKESSVFEHKLWEKREKHALEYVVNMGVEVNYLSNSERQKFRKACEPIYKKYSKYVTDYEDLMNQIEKLK